MPLVNGPELDAIVEQARKWYVERRLFLVQRMTEPYPFGTVKLTDEDQYANYLKIMADPSAQAQMRNVLFKLYRGDPNSINRIDGEIARWKQRMEAIGQSLSAKGLAL